MKNKIKKYLVVILLANLMVNCTSSKKIVYFRDVKGVTIDDTILKFEPKIQVGDLLSINVSAADSKASIPFNLNASPSVGNATTGEPSSYLVNTDGEINFPVLGKIKVAGFTSKKVTDDLTEILQTYIKNPIVNIRITNFKITVLGQVRSPGNYPIINERISILEAIALAGDLEIHGKRKNVMVIREQNGKREFITLDLTNKELFTSPYFYLAQNDVVYVEPNKPEVNSAAIGPSLGVFMGGLSFILSVITFILVL
jgi:polysaccharide export outer membrane protein